MFVWSVFEVVTLFVQKFVTAWLKFLQNVSRHTHIVPQNSKDKGWIWHSLCIIIIIRSSLSDIYIMVSVTLSCVPPRVHVYSWMVTSRHGGFIRLSPGSQVLINVQEQGCIFFELNPSRAREEAQLTTVKWGTWWLSLFHIACYPFWCSLHLLTIALFIHHAFQGPLQYCWYTKGSNSLSLSYEPALELLHSCVIIAEKMWSLHHESLIIAVCHWIPTDSFSCLIRW